MSKTRKELLQMADSIVTCDRNEQYGEPEDNFSNIAKFWSVYLGQDINGEDVSIMMILFKVARLIGSEYKNTDSWVDIIGYAACGGEIASKGGE